MGKLVKNINLAATVSCLTAALFGYSVGFIGGVLVLPSFLHHFELDLLQPHELLRAQGMTVTIWLIGTLAGVLVGMPVYSRLGRKVCLFFCASFYTAGAILQICGIGGIEVFNIGRLINGIGVGAGTLVSPLYIAEISPPDRRGMLMSGYQVALQLSAVVGFWAAYTASQIYPDSSVLQYRIPVSLQLVPGILLIAGACAIPEAPRFLAEKGKSLKLIKAVSWLRELDDNDPELESEIAQIWRSLEIAQRAGDLQELTFTQKLASSSSLRRRLAVGVGLMVAQNMAGLNAINYYAPSVFRSAGFASVSSMLFLTGLFGMVKLLAAAAFMFVFVRLRGNRFWLLLGSGACAANMFLLTGCIYLMPASSADAPNGGIADHGVQGFIAVLSVYCFAFFFGISLGPISWNICAEIFPPSLSATCCTITTLVQWLFQIVIAGITPRLIEATREWTYVVYGCCCLASFVWCWRYVPETRGVPLGAAMDRLFTKDGQSGVLTRESLVDEQAVSEEPSETTFLLGGPARRPRRESVALVV